MTRFAIGVEGRDPEIFRSFEINGKITTDTTFRTEIIEYFTEIHGRRFLDIGGSDGYEARALALRGAKQSFTLEGRRLDFNRAKQAENFFGHVNYVAVHGDARVVDSLGLGNFDVVLCFGFLYHMNNPYNVLKRIANVTSDLLLLETHVAPDSHEEKNLLAKHKRAMTRKTQSLYFDGERFEGRVCIHRGARDKSTGSLDENWSFWLTQSSLIKALTQSGFEILHFYHEIDELTPSPIREFGKKLGFGQKNTKIFCVARIRSRHKNNNPLATISTVSGMVIKPHITETIFEKLYWKSNSILNKLKNN